MLRWIFDEGRIVWRESCFRRTHVNLALISVSSLLSVFENEISSPLRLKAFERQYYLKALPLGEMEGAL